MPEKLGTSKEIRHENRRRRAEARRDKEKKIGRKLKTDEAVHHVTPNKTKIISKKENGAKHGRTNNGPKGVYLK